MDISNKKQYLNQLLEKYALLIISVFFLVLILLKIILSINFYAPFVSMDEIYYDSLAHNIIEGKLYANIGGSQSLGYPIFLSVAYLLSNNKDSIYHIMLAISAIMTSSIIFPSYFILKKYCDTTIALIGSLAVATLPIMFYYSFTIMTEALFIPLFLFSIWFIFKSYETNDKKWELLASISVVYLYITRSNGISALIAFILTFGYYVMINRKNDKIANLIMKKSFLLSTFIIFLASWVIFSSHVTDINNIFGNQEIISGFGYGSSYNISTIGNNLISKLLSVDGLLNSLRYLLNMIDYLLISTYFFVFISIFFLYKLFLNKTSAHDKNLYIIIVYLLITTFILIFTSIGYMVQNTDGEIIIGRYIDPVLPPIIILGIISIFKINNRLMSDKTTYLFAFSYMFLLFFMLFTFMYDNAIINGFINMVNNPALYSFSSFYEPFFGIYYGITVSQPILNILPAALLLIYFLIFLSLICLSIYDKRFISVLLIIMLVSTYSFTRSSYYNEKFASNFFRYNNINIFLKNNTNSSTLLIIDEKSTDYSRFDVSLYGFWNSGNIKILDVENTTLNNKYNSTIYIISSKNLTYEKLVNDSKSKLYIV